MSKVEIPSNEKSDTYWPWDSREIAHSFLKGNFNGLGTLNPRGFQMFLPSPDLLQGEYRGPWLCSLRGTKMRSVESGSSTGIPNPSSVSAQDPAQDVGWDWAQPPRMPGYMATSQEELPEELFFQSVVPTCVNKVPQI